MCRRKKIRLKTKGKNDIKKSINIGIDSEKFAALEMYLGQKNISLTDELNKCVDGLYQKYVPSNVREFIELTVVKKTPRKTKNTAPIESENQSDQ